MLYRIGKYFRKFWHILWVDESLKGWIFAFVFLFIFVKFIFFPALSLVTGTAMPLAIVESCSMYHKPIIPLLYDFDKWWLAHEGKYLELGVDKKTFGGFLLKNGFGKGDILFAVKAKPENLKIGDVIMFDAGQNNPLIHRIVKVRKEGDEYIFSTIGDNNRQSFTQANNVLGIDEINIKESKLVGRAVFKIAPYFGWLKLVFFEPFRIPQERGLCKEN